MKHSNYLIFGGVIFAVIFAVIFIFIIVIKKPKGTFLPSKCVKNPMTFTDTNAKQCVVNIEKGTPSYILFIRHCDRGYPSIPSNQPYSPQPSPPGNKIRTTCNDQTTECQGCLYPDALYGCATNLCSQLGIERSWALGKWIDCFSKSKKLPIACVLGQSVTVNSNARPLTTSSIILQSLMNLGLNPCYLTCDKSDYNNVKKQIYTSGFNGQIVVVVWDHGELGQLISSVTGVPSSNPNIHWDDCCFDQVVVIDTSVVPIGATAYNARSLEDNDICGSKCIGKTRIYQSCSYDSFPDKTSPTICPT